MIRGSCWYACAEGERPTDAFVLWHYAGCPGCSIKANALKRQFPDDPHVAWLNNYMQPWPAEAES